MTFSTLRKSCFKLVISYQFFGFGASAQPSDHWSLFTGHWSLFTGHCSLFTVHCSLVTPILQLPQDMTVAQKRGNAALLHSWKFWGVRNIIAEVTVILNIGVVFQIVRNPSTTMS